MNTLGAGRCSSSLGACSIQCCKSNCHISKCSQRTICLCNKNIAIQDLFNVRVLSSNLDSGTTNFLYRIRSSIPWLGHASITLKLCWLPEDSVQNQISVRSLYTFHSQIFHKKTVQTGNLNYMQANSLGKSS